MPQGAKKDKVVQNQAPWARDEHMEMCGAEERHPVWPKFAALTHPLIPPCDQCRELQNTILKVNKLPILDAQDDDWSIVPDILRIRCVFYPLLAGQNPVGLRGGRCIRCNSSKTNKKCSCSDYFKNYRIMVENPHRPIPKRFTVAEVQSSDKLKKLGAEWAGSAKNNHISYRKMSYSEYVRALPEGTAMPVDTWDEHTDIDQQSFAEKINVREPRRRSTCFSDIVLDGEAKKTYRDQVRAKLAEQNEYRELRRDEAGDLEYKYTDEELEERWEKQYLDRTSQRTHPTRSTAHDNRADPFPWMIRQNEEQAAASPVSRGHDPMRDFMEVEEDLVQTLVPESPPSAQVRPIQPATKPTLDFSTAAKSLPKQHNLALNAEGFQKGLDEFKQSRNFLEKSAALEFVSGHMLKLGQTAPGETGLDEYTRDFFTDDRTGQIVEIYDQEEEPSPSVPKVSRKGKERGV